MVQYSEGVGVEVGASCMCVAAAACMLQWPPMSTIQVGVGWGPWLMLVQPLECATPSGVAHMAASPWLLRSWVALS